MMKPAEKTLIKGSEGNFDYTVIAQKGLVVLALKPLVGVVPQQGAMLGVRLRAAFHGDAGGEVPIKKSGKAAANVFHNVILKKIGEQYASGTYLAPIKATDLSTVIPEIREAGLAHALSSKIVSMIEDGLLYDAEGLAELLSEAWEGHINERLKLEDVPDNIINISDLKAKFGDIDSSH